MSLNFDDKGRFFSDVVAKIAVPATIQTLTNRIKGNVYIRRGERLSDELNRSDHFLAVTEAVIYDIDGNVIHTSGFLAINREHIVWLMPDEDSRN